jgi:hypothetical protein
MTKVFRWAVVAAIALTPALTAVTAAHADVHNNASSTNVQQGDNKANTNQSGSSKSGDAVGGQVTGVVSSGRASVDATNKSDNVDVETGDSRGENNASAFVGLNSSSATSVGSADVLNRAGTTNLQEGDNKYNLNQTLTSVSGDGVGGQVIGVVTSGGSASVVAANTSTNVDIDTGDSRAFNDAAAFVGLNSSTGTSINPFGADVLNTASSTNVQEGDNKIDAMQSATSTSGDGVGGQVLGVVSAGAASVDATNKSDSVDISSGDSRAENNFASFDGLNDASSTSISTADLLNRAGVNNLQEGDNGRNLQQTASATSGDAVAGEVAGVVTSAGGSADLVLANTSSNSDTNSGDGRFENNDTSFTGLNVTPGISI